MLSPGASRIGAIDENDFKRLLDASLAETSAGLERKLDSSLARTSADFDRKLDSSLAKTSADFDRKLDASLAEMRVHFDVTAEGIKHEVRIVAEAVVRLDEKLDRETEDIRGEMRRGFAETQSMIKFSHAELDRRVRTLEDSNRTLEEGLADLQARVGRLEESTH